ncbi:Cadherin [Penicillium expansum]|uniref:Cadherin n=1 Tax=Penicillium expansum TaxID=27334 RepID=A0A0A2J9W4_PENEN|nr:Cadherin [Penicillium expansum]KGO52129.1 Cadherin [Penicillium expansum]
MNLAPSDAWSYNRIPLSLLQETVETFREVAELLKRSETTPRAHFYTHLWAHYILIREHLHRIEFVVEEDNPHVVQILNILETRVQAEILSQGTALRKFPGRRYNRLLLLSKLWQEIKAHNTDAKFEFVKKYIDLQPDRESSNEFVEYLEEWENIIVAQYPENSSNQSRRQSGSRRRKRRNPSDDVWDAAESLFDALLRSKDCGCRPVHDFASSLNCDTDEQDPDDIDPDDLLVHQCPTLVSLGVMLLELFLATPFEILAQQSGVYPANRMNFTDADTVFQNYKAEIPRNSQFYYAVEKCLDPSQPIQREQEEPYSTNSQREHTHQPSHSYPNADDADDKTLELFGDENISDIHTTEACRNYEIWESRYRAVYEKFIKNPPDNPVKIAILDTGVDETHPDIDACGEQIKGRHNWTDGPPDKRVNDNTGHGTFVAALLLKYATDAEVYIAKAIDYAVNEWKVDIITMSFGFSTREIDGYSELENAIDRAHFKNVLLLAAASNSGANNDRAYPAGEEKVICVHSTDSNGNRSHFSPTARADAINIGTIGEAVTSAWPMHLSSSLTLPVKQKSGTSFSTAIAAGIIGFLLQYVRLYMPGHAEKMKRKAKMEAVLRKIAQKTASSRPRDDYHYFSLSQHPSNLFGKQQYFVNDTLRDILDHA